MSPLVVASFVFTDLVGSTELAPLTLPARDMLERHSPSSFPSTLPAGVAEGEHRDR
ncbi:MAG TPA: hypothetical protein VKV36_07790 [Acidimicrobiales bacterium]|nr:hypothetical protein [Acidimicrobiales bacterium]